MTFPAYCVTKVTVPPSAVNATVLTEASIFLIIYFLLAAPAAAGKVIVMFPLVASHKTVWLLMSKVVFVVTVAMANPKLPFTSQVLSGVAVPIPPVLPVFSYTKFLKLNDPVAV